MRKLIYSIGATVLVATAVVVWSRIEVVPVKVSTASAIGFRQSTAPIANSIVTISPMDMMINPRSEMPVEHWSAF